MNVPPTLGFVLHDVARLLKKRFEQNARGQGLRLTRAQWQALAHLALHEGIQQGTLADLLDIEPITLVRLLDRLERNGLVERRQHPKDRRAWQLYLTDAARPLLDEMRTLGEVTRGEALTGVSDAEREQLMQLLTRMKSNLVAACLRPPAAAGDPDGPPQPGLERSHG
jgi:MarR family transcriptional regulator, transcriptional regulator for hemolysin